MTIPVYIFISTLCVSLLYGGYLLFFRNESNFSQLRLYLLVSIFFSLFMPLSNFTININLEKVQNTHKSVQSIQQIPATDKIPIVNTQTNKPTMSCPEIR